MFVELAPAYFEYISKALFNALPSLLAKVLGVYEIVIHDTVSGVKNRHNVSQLQDVSGSNLSRTVALICRVYASTSLFCFVISRRLQSELCL